MLAAWLALALVQVDENSYSSREQGFRWTVQGKGWRWVQDEKERKKLGAEGFVALVHDGREIFAWASAGPDPSPMKDYNAAALVAFGAAELEWTRRVKVAGRDGYRNRLTCSRENQARVCDLYTLDSGERKFTILAWCPESRFAENQELLEQLPQGLGFAEGVAPVGEQVIESRLWGIRYALPPGWTGGDLKSKSGVSVALFEGPAKKARGSCAIETAKGDLESYFAGYMASLELEETQPVVHSREIASGALTAEYSRTLGGIHWRYCIRILDRDGKKYRILFYCQEKEYGSMAETFRTYAGRLDVLAAAPEGSLHGKPYGCRYILPPDWSGGDLDSKEENVFARFESPGKEARGYAVVEKPGLDLEAHFDLLQVLCRKDGMEPKVHAQRIQGDTMTAEFSFTSGGRAMRHYLMIVRRNGAIYQLSFLCEDKAADTWGPLLRKHADSLGVP
jgi:hypothetical protein